MKLGKMLVVALLREQSFEELNKAHIKEEDFFAEGEKAYKWVKEYFDETSEWPSITLVEDSTGIALPTDPVPLKYAVDQVRKRALSKRLHKELSRSASLLEARDPDAALLHVKEISSEESSYVATEITDYSKRRETRVEIYEELKEAGGYRGLSTPWECLNKQIQGWVNGSLNVLIGPTNAGKSWYSCIIANHGQAQDALILLVTMEMDAYRIERRLDAVKYKLPFIDLRDGSIDALSLETWKKKAKEEVTVGNVLIADKKLVQTVSDVAALCRSHKPDMVVVDGGYRFKGSGKSNWEQTVAIVNDLQLAAEDSGVPWIVTTQYGDSSETGKPGKSEKGLRAWGVRYGKEWVINPDVAIGIYQNDDLRMINQSQLQIFKIREGAGAARSDFLIKWDMENMNFMEVSEEDLDRIEVEY